jgi:gamma-glutamyltranspeptidase / glutathione hydrolase
MGGHAAGELDVMAEQVTGRGVGGVVSAAAPIAAALGAEALRDGGNALDAAVVAALAEVVLLPPKCGLGGDLVALRLRAGADRPEALLAIGGAPGRLAQAVRSGAGLPETGGLSVGPAAAPAGYAALAEAATFDRDRLAAPAVALAHDGIVWSSICAWLGQVSADLVNQHQPEGCVYYPGRRPLAAGDVVRLPGMARLLEDWAADGEDLWAGPAGDAVVARVGAAGGVLDRDDLIGARAEWVPTVSADVGGWLLHATPAPTHGPTLLDAVVTAGAGADPGAQLAAMLAAVERRRRHLGDPVPAGTSMVGAVDSDGDAVVVIHSNSYPQFGSGLVVGEYDLILANRAGRGFTAVEGHPNFPVPGRRPATTLHAWAAGPVGGPPRLIGGTPGGANQVAWNAQLLASVLAGEERPGHLVAQPRWEWDPADDGIVVEAGFDDDALASLESAAGGSGVVGTGRWGLRCAQQVLRVPVPGEPRVAAADPRTVGLALGT